MIDKDTQTKINILNVLMAENRIVGKLKTTSYILFLVTWGLSFELYNIVTVVTLLIIISIICIVDAAMSPSDVGVQSRYKSVIYYGLKNVYYDAKDFNIIMISNNLKTIQYLPCDNGEPKHNAMRNVIETHSLKHPTYKAHIESIKKKNSKKAKHISLNLEDK